MGLKWKDGRLIEEPTHRDFTRRELVVLSLFLPGVSSFFTAMIPSCYRYPKAIWPDWLAPVVLTAFVAVCWTGTVWFWVYAVRHHRKIKIRWWQDENGKPTG